MTLHETLDSLDRLIQSRSILEHPFYVAWRRGELSRDQLATYARVYYPHVAAFPGYLRAALDVAADPVVRDELERNLADELSNPKPHGELWLDFAADLGLDRAAVAQAEPRPAARNIVATFDRLAAGESAGALAALDAIEPAQAIGLLRRACSGRSGAPARRAARVGARPRGWNGVSERGA